MKPPRIGELFAGYGGLGMGVQSVIGGEVVWFSEFDAAPSKILAHHHPSIPNHGDITKIDWSTVEPVDVLTGGFPCQDVSLAGARKGLMEGTRSGLWSEFAKAIDALRPGLVVIENVRGLLSAKTVEEVNEEAGDLEPESGGVGELGWGDRPVLNAFGRVLGDLAVLGYDAEWVGLRAADAGAPHGRYRVFIVAHDTKGERQLHGDTINQRATGREINVSGNAGDATGGAPRAQAADADPAHLGHERAGNARGWRAGLEDGGDAAADANGWGFQISQELDGDPAPTPADWGSRGEHADGHLGAQAWGNYQPAIERWEAVMGRHSPAPTSADGKGGNHRLSASFVEWMMGLPAGHVTNPAIGLTRNEQLKALGNGVVWQQAALAIRTLLGRTA